MKISLFIPCFVDQLFPQVGMDVVAVLERLGHSVDYPMSQTCCGQPAFNAGFFEEARTVARQQLDAFEGAEAVVAPSGSCVTMVSRFYPELFEGTDEAERANDLARRTFEFSQFLVDYLGVTDVGARYPGRATFHDGCHGLRELGIKQAPRTLLSHVRDLELVEMAEAETCCGFGGTFAVKFPEVSTAMTQTKTLSIQETGAPIVISNDPSCLMQIQGYAQKHSQDITCLHTAQVLAKTE